MRVPIGDPKQLFIDGPVAIYLSEGTTEEIGMAFARLEKIVNLAARLMNQPVHLGVETPVNFPEVPGAADLASQREG